MTTASTDVASYLRGRLHIAGVDEDTPLGTAIDVIMTLVIDTPKTALDDWRRRFNPMLWKVRPPDRDTWGATPDQQAAMARAAGISPRQGVADTRQSRPTPDGTHR